MEGRTSKAADQLVSKREVAHRLGLSMRTVDRLIAKGILRRVKVLGAVRCRLSEVLTIIDVGAS